MLIINTPSETRLSITMGCVSSKGDINDLHPNIFQVMNVDEGYHIISPGQIEITDTELVLHQRGKPPTRWPLRSLRKYGFDSEIFSFECGRRCATGPGIYAFQCRKAEQLFNILQHNIQVRNLSEDININLGEFAPPVQRRPQPEGYLNPTNNSAARPTLSRPGSITSNGPISPGSVPTPPLEHNNNKRGSLEHSYLNASAIEEGLSTYVNLDKITNENFQEVKSHLYMNVNTETVGKEFDVTSDVEEDPKHNYANIDGAELDIPPITFNPTLDLVTQSVPPTPTSLYVSIREINYAELDLKPAKSDQAPPDSPSKMKSYCTIDFNKTNALSQSINSRIDSEEGSRRTRHNSTICDIRQSNSISD